MLAERWGGVMDGPRCFAELRHDARDLDRCAVGQLCIDNHVACLVVRIRSDVCNVVDLSGGDARLVERREHVVEVALRRPLANRDVDTLDLFDTAIIACQGSVVTQIGAANQLHQPTKDAVTVPGDQRVFAVAARISVTGAMPGRLLPDGWRTAPNTEYSGSRLSIMLKTDS